MQCSRDTVSSFTLAENAQSSSLMLLFDVNAVLSTEFLRSPLFQITKGKRWFKLETTQKLNQIFTCNFTVSSNCPSITLAIKYNLLLLFPTSPLEVAASFRSTIPMVIAASESPLSRKSCGYLRKPPRCIYELQLSSS